MLQVDAGSLVVFRCSDIGKFKFLGEQRLLCQAGELQGELQGEPGAGELQGEPGAGELQGEGAREPELQGEPRAGDAELGTCQGLNQAHDYSRTIPPTILFR